ncbi:MAG: CAP domain-containing protein [Chloroflexi bacterium]|nr:CAP domain-containing protein [Chloroflexota bacterium]
MTRYKYLICITASLLPLCACAITPPLLENPNAKLSTPVLVQIDTPQATRFVTSTPVMLGMVNVPASAQPAVTVASTLNTTQSSPKSSELQAPARTATMTKAEATRTSQAPLRVTPTLRPTATKTPSPLPSTQPNNQANLTEFAAFERRMLELVNNDRQNAGLQPVQWDDFAANVARSHAQEMANLGYFSHWDVNGFGPDTRYGLAGGNDASMENIYMFWWRFSDGRPAFITDWDKVILDAQKALMESAGHRANILMPEHTHVGIGVVYNANTGDVRIDQVFTNRYIQLSALPRVVPVGQELDIAGFLINGASSPLINVAWEPFPAPLTVAQLASKAHPFSPTNIVSQAIAPKVNGSQFTGKVNLDSAGRAGIYHIRIFITVGGRQVLAADAVVQGQN